MSVVVTRLLKGDLSEKSSITLALADSCSFVITNFIGAYKTTEATIPFIISGTSNFIPLLNDVDFCVSIRKRVNFLATGVNQTIIKNNGNDLGASNIDSSPTSPPDLPPGFQEAYRSI